MNFTDEAIERGAKALAESLHGGRWETHFTDTQRDLWRERVRAILGQECPNPGTYMADIGLHPTRYDL